MKKLRRCIAVLLSSALISASFTGCGEKKVVTEHHQQTQISFSWWGNDTRNEYTLEAVRKFEELHPDIKVNCSYSEWSGYEARSHVRMVSNTEADVMQINFGWLSDHSPDGKGYYDLEKQTDVLDLSTFSDEYLEYGRMNGVLNAVPIAMNTETIYINQTLYEKYGLDAPKTWDDYFAAAKVMQKDGVYPMAGAQKSIWLFLLAYAEQKNGKTLLNDDGSLRFEAEDFEVMLEEYREMVEAKVIPQVEYFVRTEIDSSKYAGAIAWVSDAANYFSQRIEAGDNIVIGDYPNFDPEKSGEGWYAKPAQLYAVSKNTEQPREAAMLVDFLVNSREMALLQGVEKGIPLSSDAKKYMDEEGMLEGIQYEASQKMDANDGMMSMDSFLENADVIDVFMAECNEVLYDKASPETAAWKLYQAAKQAME